MRIHAIFLITNEIISHKISLLLFYVSVLITDLFSVETLVRVTFKSSYTMRVVISILTNVFITFAFMNFNTNLSQRSIVTYGGHSMTL